MRLSSHLIAVTPPAMEEAFRYAKAVPTDKVDWRPNESGRSVLDICKELAKCPDWAYDLLDGKGMELEAGDMAADEMGHWETIDDCETALTQKLSRYLSFIAEYPDEKLDEVIELPFGEGGSMRTFSMGEMMGYPHWNAVYHLGQIAYIQTLLGDGDNH